MIATAARAALLNMTLTLSKELVGKGIRVNSICSAWWSPGSGSAALRAGGQKPELAGVDGGYRA
jgi:NAD(P)-dependent dehydrogenase (short-subunit alcohol dehydrogenase family)